VNRRQPIESLAVLNDLRPSEFETAVAPLFEGAPAFLTRLADARPFASIDELFEQARTIAHEMPEPDQIELIDAHPRLGAPPGSVSALSHVEQGYDREAATRQADADWARLASELERLNEAYEARFGFRYCVFVRGRPREALLPEFRAALTADRERELQRAIDAVVDIARDRHSKLAAGTAATGRTA
jgi:2-oxo-4-hydroxy-4-carboxy--5-ureidoimidazoline (OHCU) decarboxylase